MTQTQVGIEVIPTEPYVDIAGGVSRAFSLTRDPDILLILDATGSIDFDMMTGNFSFLWYLTFIYSN